MSTVASFWQNYGLSLQVYKPTITGAPSPVTYTPAGTHISTLTKQIATYSHEIQAMGGYWTASMSLSLDQEGVEDWIAEGLGRHIEVYDNSLVLIWEGFVNRISAVLGPLSVVRGPLTDVANYVDLVYSFVDTAVEPPVVGGRARTGTNEDNDSEEAYGVFQKKLSSGGIQTAEATEARDQYLEERKEPKTTSTLSFGGGASPLMLQIECLGYVHMLKEYWYNYTTASGTQNLSAKIAAVIAADPNAILSTSTANIATNTISVPQWENDDKSGWDIIKSLVAKGDTSDNRYTFGIYANRVPFYAAAPTTVEYYAQLADPEQRIIGAAGSQVLPWNVLPGKWLQVSDFLVGRTTPSVLRLDPRSIFIESVSYMMPWGLTVQGGDSDKLSQKLAKLGLSGIGG